jgi:hypothetical protein
MVSGGRYQGPRASYIYEAALSFKGNINKIILYIGKWYITTTFTKKKLTLTKSANS